MPKSTLLYIDHLRLVFPIRRSGSPLSRFSFDRSVLAVGSDTLLWLLVVGAMSLDVASTAVGLSLGLVEMNPIAAIGLEAGGVAALAVLKTPVLAMAVIGWQTLPGRYRQLNLLGLALPCTGAVASNGWLIVTYL